MLRSLRIRFRRSKFLNQWFLCSLVPPKVRARHESRSSVSKQLFLQPRLRKFLTLSLCRRGSQPAMRNLWIQFYSRSASATTPCLPRWKSVWSRCSAPCSEKSWWMKCSTRWHRLFSTTWSLKTGLHVDSFQWNHWLPGSLTATHVSLSWMIGTKKVHLSCSGLVDSSSPKLSSPELCRTTREIRRSLSTNWALNSFSKTLPNGPTSRKSLKVVALSTEFILKDASGISKRTDLARAILRSCSSNYHWCTCTPCSIGWNPKLASTTAQFTRCWAEPVLCQQQVTQPITSLWWSCPLLRFKTSGSLLVSLASWPLSSEHIYKFISLKLSPLLSFLIASSILS